MSGVTVATTMRSISSGETCFSSSSFRAASVPMWALAMPLSTMCRLRMPVRSRIHSLEVSTIFSRSALVSTRGGT